MGDVGYTARIDARAREEIILAPWLYETQGEEVDVMRVPPSKWLCNVARQPWQLKHGTRGVYGESTFR